MRQGGWFQTFLCFVKALYELKAGGLKYFDSPQLGI